MTSTRPTADIVIETVLHSPMRVTRYVGHHRFVSAVLREGLRVQVTYNRDATNSGVRVLDADGSPRERQYQALPTFVRKATGVDLKAL